MGCRQNKAGGLLGHPVKLDIISDASSPAQVVTNYQKLISSDHDQLVFGPFSTLLTVPSSKVVNRFGYAFVEGAGGAPAAFGNGLQNIFDVSLPVIDNLVPFAQVDCDAARLGAAEDGRVRDERRSVHPAADPARREDHAGRRDQDRLQQGVPRRGHRLHADRRRGGEQQGRSRPARTRSTCRRCPLSSMPSSSSTTTPSRSSRQRGPTRETRSSRRSEGGERRGRHGTRTAGIPATPTRPARRWSRSTSPSTEATPSASTPTWQRPTRSGRSSRRRSPRRTASTTRRSSPTCTAA